MQISMVEFLITIYCEFQHVLRGYGGCYRGRQCIFILLYFLHVSLEYSAITVHIFFESVPLLRAMHHNELVRVPLQAHLAVIKNRKIT